MWGMDELGVGEKKFQGPAWEGDSRVGQRESEREGRGREVECNETEKKRGAFASDLRFGRAGVAFVRNRRVFLVFCGRRLCSLGSTRTLFSFSSDRGAQ